MTDTEEAVVVFHPDTTAMIHVDLQSAMAAAAIRPDQFDVLWGELERDSGATVRSTTGNLLDLRVMDRATAEAVIRARAPQNA